MAQRLVLVSLNTRAVSNAAGITTRSPAPAALTTTGQSILARPEELAEVFTVINLPEGVEQPLGALELRLRLRTAIGAIMGAGAVIVTIS